MKRRMWLVAVLGVAVFASAGYFVISAQDAPSGAVLDREVENVATEAVDSSNPASGGPMTMLVGDGTQPCPGTSSCGDCGVDHFNCYYTNTGENMCGWDGTFNPPEFQCPKNQTIRVGHCPCVGQPGQPCFLQARWLFCQ